MCVKNALRLLHTGVDKQTIVYDRVKDVILHTLKGPLQRSSAPCPAAPPFLSRC